MAACKNAATERCLSGTRNTENFKDLLALKTQSSETLLSRESFTLHPTSKTSRCALSERAIYLEERAMDLLRQPDVAFCGVVGISFTLDCVAPIDNALRWLFCSCSTGGINSL